MILAGSFMAALFCLIMVGPEEGGCAEPTVATWDGLICTCWPVTCDGCGNGGGNYYCYYGYVGI